jgi:hypothetical protein
MAVIPAKAGTHVSLMQKRKWIPAFAGMTAMGLRTDAQHPSCEAAQAQQVCAHGRAPNLGPHWARAGGLRKGPKGGSQGGEPGFRQGRTPCRKPRSPPAVPKDRMSVGRALWGCPSLWLLSLGQARESDSVAPRPKAPQAMHALAKDNGMARSGSELATTTAISMQQQHNKGRHHHSRTASALFTRNAINVHATPDNKYKLTATNPNRADNPNATSGANAAPISHAKSVVNAAPV